MKKTIFTTICILLFFTTAISAKTTKQEVNIPIIKEYKKKYQSSPAFIAQLKRKAIVKKDINAAYAAGDIFTVKGEYEKAGKMYNVIFEILGSRVSSSDIASRCNINTDKIKSYKKQYNKDNSFIAKLKQKAIRQNDLDAAVAAGDIFTNKGEKEKAKRFYNQAGLPSSSDSPTYSELPEIDQAAIDKYKKQYDKDNSFIVELKKIASVDKDINAAMALGDIYHMKGEGAKAKEFYAKAGRPYEINDKSKDVTSTFIAGRKYKARIVKVLRSDVVKLKAGKDLIKVRLAGVTAFSSKANKRAKKQAKNCGISVKEAINKGKAAKKYIANVAKKYKYVTLVPHKTPDNKDYIIGYIYLNKKQTLSEELRNQKLDYDPNRKY